MVRAPFYDKNGLKKGAWSKEEDDRLRAYVHKYGHSNWRQLPKLAGLARCGKSCRLRWLNYLRPNLKHGNYTPQEEQIIIKLHQEFGNKWSLIAEKLPGRTDNEVKNYWHSSLKKSLKSNEVTTCESYTNLGDNKFEENSDETQQFEKSEKPSSADVGDEFPHILESSLVMSTETSDVAISTTDEDSVPNPLASYEEFSSNFWTEPFLVENTFTHDEICSGDQGTLAYFIPNFDGIFFL